MPAGSRSLSANIRHDGVGELLLTKGAAASGLCNYTTGFDVNADGFSKPGVTQEDCCPICWKDELCTSVVWYEGTCWIKYGGTVVPNPGRVLCVPVNKPSPPPGPHAIETHGPCECILSEQ